MIFNFSFSGASFGNGAGAVGNVTIDMDKLTNNGVVQPGVYVWDPNTYYSQYGSHISGLITALDVTVTGAYTGNGTYHLSDFDALVFDISRFDALHPVNLTTQLVGQATNSPGGFTWGQTDIITGTPDPVLSTTGDFQIFASLPTGGGDPTAPTGVNPFQLATNGGAINPVTGLPEYMQLNDFYATPEPSTYLLLAIALGVVGCARKNMTIGER